MNCNQRHEQLFLLTRSWERASPGSEGTFAVVRDLLRERDCHVRHLGTWDFAIVDCRFVPTHPAERSEANRLDAADEKPSNSEAARAGLSEAEHKSAPAMLRTVRRSQDYG
jgi:hypothetical protein